MIEVVLNDRLGKKVGRPGGLMIMAAPTPTRVPTLFISILGPLPHTGASEVQRGRHYWRPQEASGGTDG